MEKYKRHRVIHRASTTSKFQPNMVFSCWDSIYRIKKPLLAKKWKDVTCKKCLKRRIW